MTSLKLDESRFENATLNVWRELCEKTLKGANLDDLAATAEDGFRYGPLHERCANAEPIGRRISGPWTLVQRIDDPRPDRAGRQAREDLDGGAHGLSIVFAGSPSADGFGLPLDADALGDVLGAIEHENLALTIEPHPDAARLIEIVSHAFGKRSGDRDRLRASIRLDAVGPLAVFGQAMPSPSQIAASLARLRDDDRLDRVALADGRIFHEAGATDGQELGAVLSSALLHLRALADAGWTVTEAAASIGFALGLDQRQFEEIAKLRALRLVWKRLLEECGVAQPASAVVHAETSRRMLSARDAHTNILRSTIAAFAAAVGGADSLTVTPHTMPLGLPDGAARRLARNTQLLLRDESHLAAVDDPSCGSGGIEYLTDRLAESGWNEFRRIEREGGIRRSLEDGALQARIAEARSARLERLRSGEAPLIGASLFPLAGEFPHPVLMDRPAASGGPDKDRGKDRGQDGGQDRGRLAARRTSEPLEAEGTGA